MAIFRCAPPIAQASAPPIAQASRACSPRAWVEKVAISVAGVEKVQLSFVSLILPQPANHLAQCHLQLMSWSLFPSNAAQAKLFPPLHPPHPPSPPRDTRGQTREQGDFHVFLR